MSFLLPWMLGLGALAGGLLLALHLLTTRRPPPATLPTARFVPVSEARAVSRSSKPTDLLLLAMRALAVLLIGAAFARPVLDAPGPAVRSVVLLDRSANVADARAALALARERLTEGGALLAFDTTVRVLGEESISDGMIAPDSGATSAAPRSAPGILSAALLAGTREARRVAQGADSVRLVLVSALAAEQFDAATEQLRAGWPGGVEVVRVAAVADTAAAPAVRLMSPLADDPLAPALDRLAAARGAHEVRIVRGAISAADSVWVGARSEGEARLLVHWPLVPSQTESGLVRPDGVTAFGLRPATLVAPLARLPLGDVGGAGAARPAGSEGRVVARWRDGTPAALERVLGAGCLREVGVGIPLAGDLTLRSPFAAFLAALVEPCGGARGASVGDSTLARLAGNGAAASASVLAAGASTDGTLAAWLLAIALAVLGAEWFVRRRKVA